MADRWPPIILYGVMINQAIESGNKDVMKAMHTVSSFMMDRAPEGMDDEIVDDWHKAHKALGDALG